MSRSSPPMLVIRSLHKEYALPGGNVKALQLDFLEAQRGEAIAITGPSGSGKTTMLHILSALSRPSGGSVEFDGIDVASLSSGDAAKWRAENVGYVFQDLNLLPDFDIMENLLLAAEISNVPRRHALDRAGALLRKLGLEDRLRHRPAKLSLGEQQRAAIARALVHEPPIVLADEPTASLDAENTKTVVNLLLEFCTEAKTLLLVATHDEAVQNRFIRIVKLRKREDANSCV